ncbi:MAG TPA: hypothetical protein DCR71_05655 [Dehalococcoidia bacterium]|jgi:membrane protein implicated in regulation of membrane protease activity|nr:hypothetical protein [Dehalococcoidia bacterium]
MKVRLIWAIISVILEEIAIAVIALMVLPNYGVSVPVIVLVLIMIGWLGLSVLLFIASSRALQREPVNDPEAIIGKRGVAVEEINPQGLVKIQGELWGAHSAEKIAVGEEVIVIGYTGIKLKVTRFDTPAEKNE